MPNITFTSKMIFKAIFVIACWSYVNAEIWTAKNSLKPEEIESILELHNGYRAQYGASNMLKLKWDPVLANLAEGHAQHCDDNHVNQETPDGRHAGQNLAMSSVSETYDVKYGVLGWHGEIKFWNKDTFKCDGDWTKCGHLTQLLTARTQFIGCSVRRDCPGTWKSLMVCNYYPGQTGSDIEAPYKKGPACSNCPSATCESGLCSCANEKPCIHGTFDIGTCNCKCDANYSGSGCETFACPDKDDDVCQYYGAQFCGFTNVKAECPHMCGQC